MRASLLTTTVMLMAIALSGCASEERTPAAPSAQPSSQPSPTEEGNGSLVPPSLSIPPLATPTPTPTTSPPKPGPDVQITGADFSWPQCPKGMGIPQKRTEGAPMPTAAAKFAIVGLTNGPSFVANPCLGSQLAWVKQRRLLGAAYSIVSWPDAETIAALRAKGPHDGATRLGGLRNVGYQAALFNVASMKRVGFVTPFVWVDVEPVRFFDWSSDTQANAAVVQGTVRGYRDYGYEIGFYSTPHLWREVVGDLKLGAPEWRAAGQTSLANALRRCESDWSFGGGVGAFGQWVEDGRDRNVTCPGTSTQLSRWFHQY